MTLDDVKKFLKEDDSGKKWFGEQLEEAKAKLVTKNEELIESNKRFKAAQAEAEAKAKELEDELAEAGNKDKDVQAQIDKAVGKVAKERDEFKNKYEESTGRIQRLVVDNGLTDALTKANIAKQHMPAVRALLRTEHKIEVDDTDNVAKIGDKPLSDFVTEWSQSDVGKNYVAAPNNTGGGAKGNDGTTTKGEDFQKLSPTERLKIARREGKK